MPTGVPPAVRLMPDFPVKAGLLASKKKCTFLSILYKLLLSELLLVQLQFQSKTSTQEKNKRPLIKICTI